MMKLVCLLFAVGCLAAGAAAAAERVCDGEAKGPGKSEVGVTHRLDAKGVITSTRVRWTPPSTADKQLPWLTLGYEIHGAALGPLNGVGVMAMVEAKAPPASTSAEIVIRLDDGSDWRRPWRMYGEQRGQFGRPVKGGAKPVGFFGFIPIAFAGDKDSAAFNSLLIDHFAGAKTATVTVEGNAKETFGENAYDLTGSAARDALFAEALAKADAAAKSPAACKEAKG